MGGPRITAAQKAKMRELRSAGMTFKDISDAMNISPYAVKTYAGDIEIVDEDTTTLASLLDSDEVLADIKGYEGLYQVSSNGKVVTFKTPHHPKVIKLHDSKRGGYKVLLTKDGVTKLTRVDLLVANTFCHKESDDASVLVHLDGDILNNRAKNLSWVEPQDNKTASQKKGRARLLSNEALDAIRAEWLAGGRQTNIARKYSVSVNVVHKAIEGLLRDVPEPPCEDGEEWVPIPDMEDSYYISSHGRIYSTGCGRREPRVMAASVSRQGYKHVHLIGPSGQGQSYAVHRLVAAAFCDGYDELHCIVNHKDGNPSNNRADNLEWCTPQENTRHAINELGTAIGGTKPFETRSLREVVQSPTRKSSSRRFTDEEAVAIRNDPRSARQLAKAFGVNKCTIINIRRGFTYRELP